ncbi:Inactive pancreatic lipase- protein 1 [Bulinus truncatus]|nr:Inactive pancreatic lipase- protein 1 [Bulinus truncatus]
MGSMKIQQMFAVVLLIVSLETISCFMEMEACYSQLGCFDKNPPFGISLQRPIPFLPDSPDTIGTIFKLYTRESHSYSIDLDARKVDEIQKVWSNLKKKPVKVIVHGYKDDYDKDGWLKELKNELLIYDDYNVIIVDWSAGLSSLYTQAAANTRVVGAQIAYLIQKIMNITEIASSDFHIIGHSLGGHVAGYAGERIKELGRITGLDPAGSQFDNTNEKVRLDPSDAVFVDVIHTDSEHLLVLGHGASHPLGHSDFYPNEGHNMPGCTLKENIQELGFVKGTKKNLGCSHSMSVTYFTESINTKCPFIAYPCNSQDDFSSGKCRTCRQGGCARMGFHAEPSAFKNQKFYLSTSDSKPFCQYHLEVTINLSPKPLFDGLGNIVVAVKGKLGMTNSVEVSEGSKFFQSGQTYSLAINHPSDIGEIEYVTLIWNRNSVLNWFNDIKIYVNKVFVYRTETNESVAFCAFDRAVGRLQTLLLDKKC